MSQRKFIIETIEQHIKEAKNRIDSLKESTARTTHGNRTITEHLTTIDDTLDHVMVAIEAVGGVAIGQLEALSSLGESLQDDE